MPRPSLPDDDADDPDEEYVVDRPAGWWNRELGATPAIAVTLGVGTAAVVLAIVFATTNRRPAEQPNFIVPPPVEVLPPLGPAGGPAADAAVEPGMECAISNLRPSTGLLSGFGGQPGLMFDYAFPRGRGHGGPQLLVAVVTAPGQPPATANVSPLSDDRGTVSLAPLDAFATFPRGTTVYLGTRLSEGPDGLPKRISNVLTLP